MSQPTQPLMVPQGVALTPKRGLVAWRNAVFVVFALSGLTIATWVARLPAVRDELGLDLTQVGILIFGLAAGSIVGLIAAPRILHRLSVRRAIVLCIVVNAIGLTGVGVSASLLPLPVVAIAFLALLGFGNGALDVIMNVEGAAAERAIGKTLLPLMHAFFSFGTVIGAALGAAGSALGIPVSVNFALVAVFLVIGVFVAVRFLPEVVALDAAGADASGAGAAGGASGVGGLPGSAGSSGSSGSSGSGGIGTRMSLGARIRESLSVWADTRLLFIGLILLGMAFTEGSANDWIAIATVDGHDQTDTVGAIVLGTFVAAMTVGRAFGGPLLDRYGRVAMLRGSAILGVLGLIAFILSPSLPITIVAAIAWGLGASLGFPVSISAAADDPEKSAARVSAVAIIGYLAFLGGPPLIGVLGQAFGILNALYVVLALLVMATFAVPAARERSGRFSRAS